MIETSRALGTTVCIGGLIAAGKTTLIKTLSDRYAASELACKVMPELVPDSVRSMFPENIPIGDAFIFAHRLQMAVDAPDLAQLYDVVLMERSFIDHLAFVEAFMECNLLPQHLRGWAEKVVEEIDPPIPDRFILLDVSPELACDRKNMRATSRDKVFNLEFMKALKAAYERLISQYYEDSIVLDWSNFGQEYSLEYLMTLVSSDQPVVHP